MFCNDQRLFPTAALTTKNISADGIDLITGLMVPLPSKRLTANTALHASWLGQTREPLSVKGDEDETRMSCRAEGSRNLGFVEQLLVKKTDDKAKDYDGWKALRVAADNEHEAVVKLPLKKESDVNAEERSPNYLVSYEASDKDYGWNEKADKAKNGKGMTMNVESTGKTAVEEASRVGRKERVLEDEDDIATILPLRLNILQVPDLERSNNGAEQKSQIVTHLYAAQSHTARSEMAAQMLLQNGFDVKKKDFDSENALGWAAMRGHDAAVQLLLEKGADIEAKRDNGLTALRWAAMNGHDAVVLLLLEKGANIEANEKDGCTALHSAALLGHEAVVQLLLKKGANIHAKAKYGWTALHWAATEGHDAVVRLLLEKGADIEAKDDYGSTALHWAARGGHEAVVQLLLKKGADIQTKAKGYGRTALHWAAMKGHDAVVRLLLEKGADIEAKDNYGSTALHWAAKEGCEAVVKLLKQATTIGGGATAARERATIEGKQKR